MVRILVDSATDYTPVEAQKLGIDVVRLRINVGGNEYLDGLNLGRDKFYQLCEASEEFPKTSMAPISEYADYFTAAKEAGDEVVAITMSSKLSGTYEMVLLARSMSVTADCVYVVDSHCTTYMFQILADHAAMLRDQGKSACEIASALEGLKRRVRIIAGLDTLENLAKGGRIPKAAAAFGDAVKLKPVISYREGAIHLEGMALGRKKAMDGVMKYLESMDVDYDFPFYTIYSYGDENTAKLESRVVKAGYQVTARKQIGSAIGAHIGPKAFGLVYVSRQ